MTNTTETLFSRLLPTPPEGKIIAVHMGLYWTAVLVAEIIPQADVVAIIAMTLLNGTFDTLIALCRPGVPTLIVGPTTPLPAGEGWWVRDNPSLITTYYF